MARSKQYKRVSWPPDVNLCQVRLFVSEDAPAQSGLGTQDALQTKASWLLHSSGMSLEDSLPPGFESPHPAYQIAVDISNIPVVTWKHPCKIFLDPEWRVVSGEESEEAAVQVQRELGILEHFYPQQSSVPPNPFIPSEVQDSKFDDTQTPPIPVLPIEDEEASDQSEALLLVSDSAQVQLPNSPHILSRISSGHDPDLGHHQGNTARSSSSVSSADTSAIGALNVAEPDVVAAASAAYTAILRSNEEGSMIDRDLLINILKNPSLVERLHAEYETPKPSQSAPTPLPVVRPLVDPSVAPPSHINVNTSQQASVARPPMHKLPNVVLPLVSNSQLLRQSSVVRAPSMLNLPKVPPLVANSQPSQRAPGVSPPSMHNSPNAVPPLVANSQPSQQAPVVRPPSVPSLPNAVPPLVTKSQPSPSRQVAVTHPVIAPIKDINYYKSLVQQHGGDKTIDPNPCFDNFQNNFGSSNSLDMISKGVNLQTGAKPRIQKPCAFFNTPRGCRHGASCLFLHDPSVAPQVELYKGAKRTKLNGGMEGWN